MSIFAPPAGVCDIKGGVLPLVHNIFVKAYGGSSRVVRSPPSGRQNLAQGASPGKPSPSAGQAPQGAAEPGRVPASKPFLSPRWGSREPEGFLNPGLAPWAKFFRPSGPFPSALNTLGNTLQTMKLPKPHFCVAHPR